jgi:hypothetical protein
MRLIAFDLSLNFIEEHKSNNGELISVHCSLTYRGEDCDTYILIEDIDSSYPEYAFIESKSDYHDEIIDILEANWNEISNEVKEYHKNWIKNIIELT